MRIDTPIRVWWVNGDPQRKPNFATDKDGGIIKAYLCRRCSSARENGMVFIQVIGFSYVG